MNTGTLKAIVVFLTAVVLCLPCTVQGQKRITRPSHSTTPHVDARQLEKKIHSLINRERAQQGLRPLSWDEGLHRVAMKYSRDMVERNFFSHTDPDGRSFSDRYKAEGVGCNTKIGNAVSLGAENIAQSNLYTSFSARDGKTYYNWSTEEEIAASVVKIWMDSKSHRHNILTPHFKRQGIGVWVAPDRRVYVTENFC